jgi:uncharacterized protein (TIGR02147 family)
MTSTPARLRVYDYQDYRLFLAEWFAWRKSLNRHFSHRLFARKAGIKSSGYFTEVVNGTRNISRSTLPRFVQGLELDAGEAAYLERLVAFNHARTSASKQALYAQLIQALPAKAQQLRLGQMEYFSKWYYVAVREALAICDVKDEYETLASRLQPRITAAQAKAAVRLLDSLGLVERNAEGLWKARHATLLSKREESAPLLVRAFQGEMIGKAREALETVPQEHRDISTVTMSISAGGMARIKEAVEEFRGRIRDIVRSDRGEDRLAQLNIQLFPLTRVDDLPPPRPEDSHASP